MFSPELSEFGLKVDTYTAKPVKGRVRYLELDWPGGTRAQCKVYNLADAAEHRRRTVAHNKKRRKRQGIELRKKMKKNEKHKDDDGKWWFSLRYAVRYLNKFFRVSKPTVQAWSRDDGYCVYLRRAVKVKQLDDGKGHFVDFLSKDDLDLIRAARRKLAKRMAKRTLSQNEAINILVKNGSPTNTAKAILDNVPSVPAIGARADGRPLTMTRFSRKTVVKIGKKLKAHYSHPTLTATAEELGTDVRTLRDLIQRDLLHVIPSPYRGIRGTRVDRKEVNDLKKSRARLAISKDHEGTWWPCCLACSAINGTSRGRRFPNATIKILYKYANKPCPQLGGDILRAKEFVSDLPMLQRGQKEVVLKFHESDLKKLKPGKVGKPGQEAAQAARQQTEAHAVSTRADADPLLHEIHQTVTGLDKKHDALHDNVNGMRKEAADHHVAAAEHHTENLDEHAETKAMVTAATSNGKKPLTANVLTFEPGKFVFKGIVVPLRPAPLRVLKALHKAGRPCTEAELTDAVNADGGNIEKVTLRGHISAARVPLKDAIKQAGGDIEDPIPCVQRGKDSPAAWELILQ